MPIPNLAQLSNIEGVKGLAKSTLGAALSPSRMLSAAFDDNPMLSGALSFLGGLGDLEEKGQQPPGPGGPKPGGPGSGGLGGTGGSRAGGRGPQIVAQQQTTVAIQGVQQAIGGSAMDSNIATQLQEQKMILQGMLSTTQEIHRDVHPVISPMEEAEIRLEDMRMRKEDLSIQKKILKALTGGRGRFGGGGGGGADGRTDPADDGIISRILDGILTKEGLGVVAGAILARKPIMRVGRHLVARWRGGPAAVTGTPRPAAVRPAVRPTAILPANAGTSTARSPASAQALRQFGPRGGGARPVTITPAQQASATTVKWKPVKPDGTMSQLKNMAKIRKPGIGGALGVGLSSIGLAMDSWDVATGEKEAEDVGWAEHILGIAGGGLGAFGGSALGPLGTVAGGIGGFEGGAWLGRWVDSLWQDRNKPAAAAPIATQVGKQTTKGLSIRERARKYEPFFAEAAARYGVPKDLLIATAMAESRMDPNAVSGAGAEGIMQFMPETAREYGLKDPFDPQTSIHAGAKKIRNLLKLYDGDWKLALGAYNAGQGTMSGAGRANAGQGRLGAMEKGRLTASGEANVDAWTWSGGETRDYVNRIDSYLTAMATTMPEAAWRSERDGLLAAHTTTQPASTSAIAYLKDIRDQLFSLNAHTRAAAPGPPIVITDNRTTVNGGGGGGGAARRPPGIGGPPDEAAFDALVGEVSRRYHPG